MKRSTAWLNQHTNSVLSSRVSTLPVMARFGTNNGGNNTKPKESTDADGNQFIVVGKTVLTGTEVVG